MRRKRCNTMKGADDRKRYDTCTTDASTNEENTEKKTNPERMKCIPNNVSVHISEERRMDEKAFRRTTGKDSARKNDAGGAIFPILIT